MQNKQINMAQVAKTQKPKKKRKLMISPVDFKQLKQAHEKLYTALFRRELLAGKTIGAASHNAFEIIKSKIKTMDRGPVRRCLALINAINSRWTKKRILSSKNDNATVAFMPEKQKDFESTIPTDISNALNVINTLSAQYKPKQKTVAKQVQKPVTKPMVKSVQNTVQKPFAKQTELATVKQNKQQLIGFMSTVVNPLALIFNRQRQNCK